MTRELKLALIVGFSLVLVVMVLVSDHLSKARKAELAPPANEIALSQKIGTPQANALNPSDGSAPINPNAISDPLAIGSPTGGTGFMVQPVEIRQGVDSGKSIEDQRLSLEKAAEKLGMAAKGSDSQPLMQPTISAMNETPFPISNANTPGVTPLGDSGAPAPLSPTKYAPVEGVKLGVVPMPVETAKSETAAATTSDKMHKVESGQSLYAISKQYYGSGKYWKQLLEYNKATVKSENSLKLGMKIKIPDLAALTGKPSETAVTTIVEPKTVTAKPLASKGKTYVVQKGDTPGKIAQKALGTSKRAQELMDLNKISDDGGLRIGMVLQLPQ